MLCIVTVMAMLTGCGTGSNHSTPSEKPPISAPSELRGVSVTTSQITLTWTAVSSATTYRVYRHHQSGHTNLTAVATLSAAQGSTYTDHGLTPATRYYYWLRACDESICSVFSPALTMVTKDYAKVFKADDTRPVISGWYDRRIRPQGARVVAVFTTNATSQNGWIIRSAEGNYYRLRVAHFDIQFEKQSTYQITFIHEKYDTAAVTFDVVKTAPVLSLATTPVSVGQAFLDLESNRIVSGIDSTKVWDVSISWSYKIPQIRLNGGGSGSGTAALGRLNYPTAADITDPTDGNQVRAFSRDDFYNGNRDAGGGYETGGLGGLPGTYGYFEYFFSTTEVPNSRKKGHAILPNFTVYVVKTEESYYKMQVIGYYGKDGRQSSGRYVIRYAPLDNPPLKREENLIEFHTGSLRRPQTRYVDFSQSPTKAASRSHQSPWHMMFHRYKGGLNRGVRLCIAKTFALHGINYVRKDPSSSVISSAFNDLLVQEDKVLAAFNSVNFTNTSCLN